MEAGERAELEGVRDFYRALSEVGAGALGEVGGAVCGAIPALAHVTMVNRVLGLGLAEAPTEAHLVEIEDFFARAGADIRFIVSVRPAADRDLEPLLRRRGFEPGYAWAVFRRGVEPYEARTDLRIQEVGRAGGRDFAHVVARAYGFPAGADDPLEQLPGRPGWHCYVAYAGAEPAGAAAMFVDGDAAWFSLAGTLPEHRGKGSQNAIMAARIDKARELGVRTLATETGELVPDRPSSSYRNILRVGFELQYVRPNYVSASD